MVYKPTNITGGPQTVWGCLKIGHPKNLSMIIFPNEIDTWTCSEKNHFQSHPCTNTPWNLMVLHHVPPFSNHVPPFSHHVPPFSHHFPPLPIMFQHFSNIFPPFSHHVPQRTKSKLPEKDVPGALLGQEFIANITGEMAALANNSVTGCHHCG